MHLKLTKSELRRATSAIKARIAQYGGATICFQLLNGAEETRLEFHVPRELNCPFAAAKPIFNGSELLGWQLERCDFSELPQQIRDEVGGILTLASDLCDRFLMQRVEQKLARARAHSIECSVSFWSGFIPKRDREHFAADLATECRKYLRLGLPKWRVRLHVIQEVGTSLFPQWREWGRRGFWTALGAILKMIAG